MKKIFRVIVRVKGGTFTRPSRSTHESSNILCNLWDFLAVLKYEVYTRVRRYTKLNRSKIWALDADITPGLDLKGK